MAERANDRVSPSWLRRALVSGLLALMLSTGGVAAQAQSRNPEAYRYYNMGIQAYNQGNVNEAIKQFQRATQADPNYANAHFNLGSLYYQTGRYDQAKAAFERSLALDPMDSSTRYNLALTLEKMRQYDQAIAVLNRIPPGDPKGALAQAKINELRSLMPKTVPNGPQMPYNPIGAQPPQAAPPTQPTSPPTKSPEVDPAKIAVETFSKGFSGPTGMTFGPGGFLYVSSFVDNQVYKVGADGNKVVFAKGDQIKGPMDIVYNDKTNELYVVNYLLNNVARISATGKVSTLTTGLRKPYNLLLDTQNNTLYVSEQENNTVARIKLY